MRKNKIIIILVLLLGSLNVHSQYLKKYISPVDFSFTLAGNVGEVRPNHFHSGIDIKASKGVGSPIFAVSDGYVSRVGVAPSGYGNFVMVTHNDGLSSLYAHLHEFSNDLKNYVEQEQLKRKSYAIDLYLTSGKFPVSAGTKIGTLGNSGSSGGPHLHFEIRDHNANPVNLLSRNMYKAADKVAPSCLKIFVYQCDTISGMPVFSLSSVVDFKENSDGKLVPTNDTIKISKNSYLAYEVIDYKDGKSNTMGVFGIKQSIDSVTNFEFEIDKISYATTRYINAFVQFDQNSKTKYHVIRAYISPNNKLDIYRKNVQRGLITVPSQGQVKHLETIIKDDANNSSKIKLNIARSNHKDSIKLAERERVVAWNQDTNLYDNNFSVHIPFEALYENVVMPFGVIDQNYVIGHEGIALQDNITLRLRAIVVDSLKSKVCFARIKKNGALAYVGGIYKNGHLEAKTRNFGTHTITYDTIAPTIIPAISKNATLKNPYIQFTIKDDLSGIGKYNIYIDNKWVIGEFDPKKASLRNRVTLSSQPKSHPVKVVIVDKKGNTQTLNTSYKW